METERPIKTMKMVRDIRDQINRQIEGKTSQEIIEFYRESVLRRPRPAAKKRDKRQDGEPTPSVRW